ncbi:hypothetical protein ACIOEW_03845 [Streptomyces sp. NPDC087901]|uniref:hypothetical protein n=1 Tax=Streptomyces sp. NPDC087901 TaxID=3365818 RepID=UPI003822D3E0
MALTTVFQPGTSGPELPSAADRSVPSGLAEPVAAGFVSVFAFPSPPSSRSTRKLVTPQATTTAAEAATTAVTVLFRRRGSGAPMPSVGAACQSGPGRPGCGGVEPGDSARGFG